MKKYRVKVYDDNNYSRFIEVEAESYEDLILTLEYYEKTCLIKDYIKHKIVEI